jgi:hypothetical protein
MEQMINVYFDNKGSILAVTPEIDHTFSDKSVATFPLEDVNMFLTGMVSLSNYTVVCTELKDKKVYKLLKKVTRVSYVRSIDNYPVKINPLADVKRTILIENRIKEKVIAITIDKEFKGMYNNGTDEQQEIVSDFLSQGLTSVYITRRNDPYFLLLTVKFLPKQLFDEDSVYINYDDECNDTSAYAKRIIGGYTYKEKL